jgi:hypothetical protein
MVEGRQFCARTHWQRRARGTLGQCCGKEASQIGLLMDFLETAAIAFFGIVLPLLVCLLLILQ